MKRAYRILISLLLSHGLLVVLSLFAFTYLDDAGQVWALLGVATLAIVFVLAQYRLLKHSARKIDTKIEAIKDSRPAENSSWTSSQIFETLETKLDELDNKFEELRSRTNAEVDVKAAEAKRLRMILNSIQDGVFALDKDKHIILFNRAASDITGLSIDVVAGKHLNEVLPLTQNKKLVLSQWIDSCQGADMQQTTWEGLTLENESEDTLSLDVYAQYIGADPSGVRTLVTFHNRTEEQQIEDMKVDFVALAAHELRTPVTAIKGYAEILNQEIADNIDSQHQEFLRRLEVSASQLAGSINNILHVSHIEHGELNLDLESVKWEEIVEGVVTELQEKARTQNKSIHTDIPEGLPTVAADRISITEVLTNLIDNALKYSQPDQEVTVQVWHDETEQTVKTAVIDHGTGMPPNTVGKLFTKFYRSHRTRNSHRGTGLGLYMSKNIVEAHGGQIQVESKEGEGSTFTFALPTIAKQQDEDDNEDITRGVHGWIKNHSLYRG